MQPSDVIVPFAPAISTFINEHNCPIATRRAYKKALGVVKAIASLYQHQRQRDQQGRIVAEMQDYCMAYQIMEESFAENMGKQSKTTNVRLDFVREKGQATLTELMKHTGVSKAAISRWAAKQVQDGKLVWCNQDGNEYGDFRERERDKKAGRAFVKAADADTDTIVGLPSPYELTGNPVWQQSGEMWEAYNLSLDARVSTAVNPLLTPLVNSENPCEVVDLIHHSSDKSIAVNVLHGSDVVQDPWSALDVNGDGYANDDDDLKALIEEVQRDAEEEPFRW